MMALMNEPQVSPRAINVIRNLWPNGVPSQLNCNQTTAQRQALLDPNIVCQISFFDFSRCPNVGEVTLAQLSAWLRFHKLAWRDEIAIKRCPQCGQALREKT